MGEACRGSVDVHHLELLEELELHGVLCVSCGRRHSSTLSTHSDQEACPSQANKDPDSKEDYGGKVIHTSAVMIPTRQEPPREGTHGAKRVRARGGLDVPANDHNEPTNSNIEPRIDKTKPMMRLKSTVGERQDRSQVSTLTSSVFLST